MKDGRVVTEGQHFHLYLIGYGLYRFSHEFQRATPKPFQSVSGYRMIAAAADFWKRQMSSAPANSEGANPLKSHAFDFSCCKSFSIGDVVARCSTTLQLIYKSTAP